MSRLSRSQDQDLFNKNLVTRFYDFKILQSLPLRINVKEKQDMYLIILTWTCTWFRCITADANITFPASCSLLITLSVTVTPFSTTGLTGYTKTHGQEKTLIPSYLFENCSFFIATRLFRTN